MNPERPNDRPRIEWIVVALATIAGGIIRAWGLPRLGLSHFDEGIYALAGSWVFNPKGIAAIDPIVIAYAPPGFPMLVGISYTILGMSDTAAILVSILAGTLTIPVVAWLGRRTFGPGAGAASAILVALSGPHIAFSRMALTDASFLLAWTVAIGIGQRFLEKPGIVRALAMGLAVGLAQQFKYNGWLVGAIVIATAILRALVETEQRRGRNLSRTFGWGLFAAVVAGLVVLPWFRFVEAHGGYSALLKHQQSYLLGFGRWLPSLRTQASQAVALSGGRFLVLIALGLAIVGARATRWASGVRDSPSWSDRVIALVVIVAGAILLVAIPNASWWLGVVLAPGLLLSRSPSRRLVGVWWAILSVMTPLYHPYARLWLPMHAVGWLILGGSLADGFEASRPFLRRVRGLAVPSDPGLTRFGFTWAWAMVVAVACSIDLESIVEPSRPLPDLLGPTDSLREAANTLISTIPKEVKTLRVYGRPCLNFYLGQRISVFPQESPETTLRPADPSTWALFDGALWFPQNWPEGIERWESTIEIPTQPALPTLLDIDPKIATERGSIRTVMGFPLIPLRPRSRGPSR